MNNALSNLRKKFSRSNSNRVRMLVNVDPAQATDLLKGLSKPSPAVRKALSALANLA